MLRSDMTNHTMLKNLLAKYEPETWGVCTGAEVTLITNELHLKEMTIRELKNMRDHVVMTWAIQRYRNEDNKESQTTGVMTLDKMSAITYIIDKQIVELGGEV